MYTEKAQNGRPGGAGTRPRLRALSGEGQSVSFGWTPNASKGGQHAGCQQTYEQEVLQAPRGGERFPPDLPSAYRRRVADRFRAADDYARRAVGTLAPGLGGTFGGFARRVAATGTISVASENPRQRTAGA